MNRILRISTIAAAFATTTFAAGPAAGYVDFGKIMPGSEGKFVEINLPQGLLKFAAMFASKQEPQAAEVLGNLKQVRVNVVELNTANREQVIGQVKAVRQELETQGWTQIMTVREQPKGDDPKRP